MAILTLTKRYCDGSEKVDNKYTPDHRPGIGGNLQGYIGCGKPNPTKRAQLTATDSGQSSQYASIGR